MKNTSPKLSPEDSRGGDRVIDDGIIDQDEALIVEQVGQTAYAVKTPMVAEEGQIFEHPDEVEKGKLKRWVAITIRVGLIFLVVLLGLVILTVTFHAIAPVSWHWIKDKEQLHKLWDFIAFLLTGAAGTFLSKYFRRAFVDLDLTTRESGK